MIDTLVRSIRFPGALSGRIEQEAMSQDRSFNGQVLFLLKLGFSVLDGKEKQSENSASDLLQSPISQETP